MISEALQGIKIEWRYLEGAQTITNALFFNRPLTT